MLRGYSLVQVQNWYLRVLLVVIFGCFVTFPQVVSASAGADGAGAGGNVGTPTSGGGTHTASSSWTAATSTTWTVPSNVTEVKIKVWGAGGAGGWGGVGNAGPTGGAGGYTEGLFAVTPGQVLTIDVGSGGTAGGNDDTPGTGGGFSAVASGTTNWAVAGAGGAGGNSSESAGAGAGGAGGGTTGFGGGGGAEGTDTGDNGGDGGDAGTDTAAGAGGAQGTPSGSAGSGTSGGGGGDSDTNNVAGGGGGDGYFGGGGGGASETGLGFDTSGAAGGGGGGSSFVHASGSASAIAGGSGATTANASDSDYVSGVGSGGSGGAAGGNAGSGGGDGAVVLWYTPDNSPPTPNPPFMTIPSAITEASISIVAGTVTDDTPPVEYIFNTSSATCGSDYGTGSAGSSWQSSTSYTDTGLQTNRCYGYTVTARDSLGNTGSASFVGDAYTAAAVPGGVTFGSISTSTIEIFNNANGNPASNPTTEFAVQVSATSPTDATWDGQYVDGSGNPSATAVWLSDAALDGLTLTGLASSTQYTFQAKARNGDNTETAFSATTNTNTTGETDPPTPNPSTFSSLPDGASVSSVDMIATTASDASPVEYYFTAAAGTCGADHGTGGTGSGWQSSTSYTDTGLQTNRCYGYTVTAQDILGNAAATSSVETTYTEAAVPGVVTFANVTATSVDITNDAASNPASNPTTEFAVQVSATSPTDATWDGQYVDGSGNPSATAVWLSDAELDGLTLTDLNEFTSYTLQAKARNADGDETSFSTTAATTTTDTTAPTPDPMTFAIAPDDVSTVGVDMTASTATDDNTGVEYYFTAAAGTCGADHGTGGTDSGWQSSTSYTDTGLQTNRCYGYAATARDAFGNTTSQSTTEIAYTAAMVPGAPTIVDSSGNTITINNNANGNPASNPTTEFAVQVSATSPTDATWDGQYVDGSGNPSATAVWLSDAALDGLVLTDLNPLTTYTLRAKARNADSDETAFSATNQDTTTISTAPNNVRIIGGVKFLGGVRIR